MSEREDGIETPRRTAGYFDAFALGTAALGVITAVVIVASGGSASDDETSGTPWMVAFLTLMSFLLSALLLRGVAVFLRWLAAAYGLAADEALPIMRRGEPRAAPPPPARGPQEVPEGWENRWE